MLTRIKTSTAAIALLLSLATALPVLAHHSFAVFFDSEKMITMEGVVEQFQFRNPHGLISFTVRQPDGKSAKWRAETNSPSILERRGWKRDSLKAGDQIKVEGWPARDGSNYMRMRSVVRADGAPVGVPFETTEQK
ncbi:MAG: hypothetical protein LBE59_06085 [Nevskiaceae bacterium]|jgi:hypothetical protein|nr:hypothetical protein [Nevskiaceae bacterium]